MHIAELYELFKKCTGVATDTRKIKTGDLFFALRGENFNGNVFAQQALEAGAVCCVCDDKAAGADERIIYVDDALRTLQLLALRHREHLNIPVLAITGSNGKTTTKELIHAVLSSHLRCYTTAGNLNNHIGVPLTLLSIKNDAEIAVVEMGANHLKEIESYCAYALPTHGLITNCGKAHLEGFGSEEGVKKGKGELFEFLAANDGTAFINTDLDYLNDMSAKITHRVSYGTAEADLIGNVRTTGMFVSVEITRGADIGTITTKLAGAYNGYNILSAVAVGKCFGVPDKRIAVALANYEPDNSRSQVITYGSNKIVLDAYNANPSSMKAAIENFAAAPCSKKVVILGSMKEMGEASDREHAGLIDLLQSCKWEKAVLTGPEFKNVPPGMLHFSTTEETREWFQSEKFENALILIKGSRGMAMEKIL